MAHTPSQLFADFFALGQMADKVVCFLTQTDLEAVVEVVAVSLGVDTAAKGTQHVLAVGGLHHDPVGLEEAVGEREQNQGLHIDHQGVGSFRHGFSGFSSLFGFEVCLVWYLYH